LSDRRRCHGNEGEESRGDSAALFQRNGDKEDVLRRMNNEKVEMKKRGQNSESRKKKSA